MPTSFSRILNEEDLAEVRSQYLQALEALQEEEEQAEAEGPDARSRGGHGAAEGES